MVAMHYWTLCSIQNGFLLEDYVILIWIQTFFPFFSELSGSDADIPFHDSEDIFFYIWSKTNSLLITPHHYCIKFL